MDVKNMIAAAEFCKKHDAHCIGCPAHLYGEVCDIEDTRRGSDIVLALRDHYQSREKAIFDELREWAETVNVQYTNLMEKLTELEGVAK